MTCGIYMIKNHLTEQLYIGRSYNIEYRWESHRATINPLHLDINRYGIKDFDCYILEELVQDTDENNSDFNSLMRDKEYNYMEKFNISVDSNNYNLICYDGVKYKKQYPYKKVKQWMW